MKRLSDLLPPATADPTDWKTGTRRRWLRRARSALAMAGAGLLLVAARPSRAQTLAELDWFASSPVAPDGRLLDPPEGLEAEARLHLNTCPPPGWAPPVAGRMTVSCEETPDWPDSLALPRELDWPPEDALQAIREACSPQHRWAAAGELGDLTTQLRFFGEQLAVSQYAESGTTPGDTAWALPWTWMDLPRPPAAQPLIWVEGVARLQGIVSGRLTVLVSDSCFVTGDLLVADADTVSCGNPSLFGRPPADSPHRIGLIGESDVLLAATPANGLGNGAFDDACPGGPPPVIHGCDQHRRDVIVCAQILALGCGFGAECWKTTATGAELPSPTLQPFDCGGLHWNWEEAAVVDCPAPAGYDLRGHFWLSGSLAMTRPLPLLQNPPGPMGDAWIGYYQRNQRRWPAASADPPPYWPDPAWQSIHPPEFELRTGANSACGTVTDRQAFLTDVLFGSVMLHARAWRDPDTGQPARRWLTLRAILDGDTLVEETRWLADSLSWRPLLTQEELATGVDLHFEAVWGDEPGFGWNLDQGECDWWLDGSSVDDPLALLSTPALGVPYPNPFNPATRVTVTLARPGTVRLALVDLLGREARVVREGPLPAGEHAISVDGAGLPSGLYLLRLELEDGAVEARKLLVLK